MHSIYESLEEAYSALFDASTSYSHHVITLKTLAGAKVSDSTLRNENDQLALLRQAVREQEGRIDELLLQLENA